MEDKFKREANRVINVTYMLSGVLEQSFQSMDEALDRAKKRLKHEDRRLVNEIRRNIKYLRSNIEILRSISVGNLDEETIECYDDTTLRFYVIFMRLLEIAGIDNLCDLRLYTLNEKLKGYKGLVIYPDLDYQSKLAFLQIERDIANGLYSVDEMKNLFQKDEDRDKETKGNI